MAQTTRTFVAVEVPVSDELRVIIEELRDMGRTVRPVVEPLHLTLKFLGETDTSLLPSISSVLDDVATSHRRSDIAIHGLGAFPRIERPSVVWAGVTPAELLAALAADLEDPLESLGFARESRAFHSHVTLARVKGRPPRELPALLTEFAAEDFGMLPIRQLTLIQSKLTPQGPRYTTLHTSPLSK